MSSSVCLTEQMELGRNRKGALAVNSSSCASGIVVSCAYTLLFVSLVILAI